MSAETYNPRCVRRVANWTRLEKTHKLDFTTFEPTILKADIPVYSPKLDALIKNITELDEQDVKAHGKKFKHFIFSTVKDQNAGAKIISAGLISYGYKLAYDDKLALFSDEKLLKTKGNNFSLMTSVPLYGRDFKAKIKKDILSKFNERPKNAYGDLVRIMVLDPGYKEGIDLFDVKYVHIFEHQSSKADLKQAIGRATRFCGQKGLQFQPKAGWPLKVFLYDVTIPENLRETFGSDTLFDLFVKYSDIDLKQFEFAEELEKYCILGSVDYELNKNIHEFKIEEEHEGGSKQILCDKKCGLRPTKDVPASVPLMASVFFAQNRALSPSDKNTAPREIFCNLLKSDKTYCSGLQSAFDDPVEYVKKYESELKRAILDKRHYVLKQSPRSSFLKFVGAIINIKKERAEAERDQPVSQNNKLVLREMTPVDDSSQKDNKKMMIVEKVDEPDYGADSMPQSNFEKMRKYVRDNFLEFSWPKVKLENLCAEAPNRPLSTSEKSLVQLAKLQSGGAPHIIHFTPTQNFVSRFFVPESPYKGLILWHSVGSGKTCSAIAAATNSFEKEKYTILWVTRASLKSDIWKNMFDMVCSASIKQKIESGLRIPDKLNDRLKLLSSAWSIRPISYKQFTNLIEGKNQYHEELVRKNGKNDPLKKTLLIIDEAHKLYGQSDLSGSEKPDMKALHDALMNSYVKSGRDSVKVLLMTGTPITNDPMEIIKLVNLLKPPKDQMADEYDKFAKEYLDDVGKFTKKGSEEFLDEITGYISYLNREKDARQFAQPKVVPVVVPMSVFDTKKFDEFEERLEKKELEKEEAKTSVEMLIQAIKDKKAEIKAECREFKPAERRHCMEQGMARVDKLIDELIDAKSDVERIKQEYKYLKSEYTAFNRDLKNDNSQESTIKNKCRVKPKTPRRPKQKPQPAPNPQEPRRAPPPPPPEPKPRKKPEQKKSSAPSNKNDSFDEIINDYLHIATSYPLQKRDILIKFHPDKLPQKLKDLAKTNKSFAIFSTRVFDQMFKSGKIETEKDLITILEKNRRQVSK